jgi:hypothetical protein
MRVIDYLPQLQAYSGSEPDESSRLLAFVKGRNWVSTEEHHMKNKLILDHKSDESNRLLT